jgi:hypothetical protein
MTDPIDPIHFQDLAAMDPGDVCRRALCRWDPAAGKYTVPVWGDVLHIFPLKRKIESEGAGLPAGSAYFHLFALHYLLGATAVETAGAWISEKEIPGGATFFRGPHRIPTDTVSSRFGNDLDEFRKRCEQLAGEPIQMADAAYTFNITQRIPVAVLYWRGDDEFPAECKILYDKTIGEHLAADIVYAMGVGICRTLATER